MDRYIPPGYSVKAFNCPYCHTFTSQNWDLEVYTPSHIKLAQCFTCKDYSIWYKKRLIYPADSVAPISHPDLPKALEEDYEEARAIISRSPRSAMALLRLLIEKLTNSVLEDKRGKDLNDNIGILGQELPPGTKDMLDIIRVTGNEAVHPGKIDNRDNSNDALALFKMVNLIVERVITGRKTIKSMRNNFSKDKKEAISRRDKRHASKKSK